MELAVPTLSFASFSKTNRQPKHKYPGAFNSSYFLTAVKQEEHGSRISVSSALPETAASVAFAATVVGAAATLLVQRRKASEAADQIPLRVCEDCSGSGICSECKGEGFVLKKLSEETAERARLASKNAATRYTAGLPKKWSYCTKCSSARSCSTCGGRGKLSY